MGSGKGMVEKFDVMYVRVTLWQVGPFLYFWIYVGGR